VDERPNILFFHVDNLGFGELSCYSGGPFRGTWTPRIDAFAGQGFRLTNYAPEAQCTPTRSALLTGRHAIRSGNHSVPLGASGGWGLVAWEQTLGDLLSGAGYGCAACFARGGGAHAEFIAGLLDRMTADAETIDWWERTAPRRRQ
jgi:arylsulfatase